MDEREAVDVWGLVAARKQLADERAWRLGGRGAGGAGGAALAALSRAGRRPRDAEERELAAEWTADAQKGARSPREGEGLPRAGSSERSAGEEGALLSTVVLFHLLPFEAGQRCAPVDVARFVSALQGELRAGHASGLWSAVCAGGSFVRLCVRFHESRDGERAYARYAAKVLGNYRVVYHGGAKLRCRAVSHKAVFRGSSEEPFARSEASEPVAWGGARAGEPCGRLGGGARDAPKAGGGAGRSAARAGTRDAARTRLRSLELPALLDELGDEILAVQAAFDKHDRGRGALIGRNTALAALREVRTVDHNALGELSEARIALDRLDLAAFCRCCALLLGTSAHGAARCAGPELSWPLSCDPAAARAVFERHKLFPTDDWISLSDLGAVLDRLALAPAGVDAVQEEAWKRGCKELRWEDFVELLEATLLE
jgi:hypothetical protein